MTFIHHREPTHNHSGTGMRTSILAILIALLIARPLAAQEGDPTGSSGPLPYTFTQFGTETGHFILQPGNWETADWLTIAAIGATASLLMFTVDEPVREAVGTDQRFLKSVPVEFGRMWGDLSAPVVLFSGFAVYSLATGDTKTRKIGYEIGQASLYAGALTYILKFAIGRSRPFIEEGATSFHPFSTFLTSGHQSLPGGHNAAAFVLSTVLSRNVDPLWLKILAYVPAALTFFSRIYQDRHWTSDNVTGAALGYLVATWVVDQHESRPAAEGMTLVSPFSIRITF